VLHVCSPREIIVLAGALEAISVAEAGCGEEGPIRAENVPGNGAGRGAECLIEHEPASPESHAASRSVPLRPIAPLAARRHIVLSPAPRASQGKHGFGGPLVTVSAAIPPTRERGSSDASGDVDSADGAAPSMWGWLKGAAAAAAQVKGASSPSVVDCESLGYPQH